MPKPKALKNNNRIAILQKIKEHGLIARKDIAELTGLSRATVTHLTADLINEGLIFEKGEGDSNGGRRPVYLALTHDRFFVVGVKLTKFEIILVLTNLNAQIVAGKSAALSSADAQDPPQVARILSDSIFTLLDERGLDADQVLGVGIGVSGLVDTRQGFVKFSIHNRWYDVPFAQLLQKSVPFPIFIDNDVITLAMREKLYGEGRNGNDFMLIFIGQGVGMSVVADSRVYRGANGFGIEFGHIALDPAGEICTCGNRGCLETFIADPWMVKRAQQQAGLDVTSIEDLTEAVKQKNPAAIALHKQAYQTLGQQMANSVNLFGPKKIIINSQAVHNHQLFLDIVRTELAEHTYGNLGLGVEIEIKPIDDSMWAQGAASLVLENLFRTPRVIA